MTRGAREEIYVSRLLKGYTPKTYKCIGSFVARELSSVIVAAVRLFIRLRTVHKIFGLLRRLFLSLLREIRGGRIKPRGTGGCVAAW